MPCTVLCPLPTILMGEPAAPEFFITSRLSAITPCTQIVSPGSACVVAASRLAASVATLVHPVGAGSGRIAPRPSGEVVGTGLVPVAGACTVGAGAPQPATTRPAASSAASSPTGPRGRPRRVRPTTGAPRRSPALDKADIHTLRLRGYPRYCRARGVTTGNGCTPRPQNILARLI